MSVGDDIPECPLCMELLELDDINFYPCTCGYQVCRFCWHRLRTDENGLCPACRKPYQEDPAEFKPLTEDELQRIKKERRQKDLQRKQKAAESRKHLANVRVVQKNLVFVVGLSQRLADSEVLKKHEYFGKFGKIHKVVINHSTSYAGAQGPSASAYVTYHRFEDALKALQSVNNVYVDGRTIKASLGTTKYCSHFLRGSQCPKPDCMYLHDLGDQQASFTKEEMQQGKHNDYEQHLIETYMNTQNNSISNGTATTATAAATGAVNPQSKISNSRKKAGSPVPKGPTLAAVGAGGSSSSQLTPPLNGSTACRETWPSLAGAAQTDARLVVNGNRPGGDRVGERAPGNHRHRNSSGDRDSRCFVRLLAGLDLHSNSSVDDSPGASTQRLSPLTNGVLAPASSLGGAPSNASATAPSLSHHHPSVVASNEMSFFSGMSGFASNLQSKPSVSAQPDVTSGLTNGAAAGGDVTETVPVSTTTDWQAAFGFPSTVTSASGAKDVADDDLGFDPWDEASKSLADLMERECGINGTSVDRNHRNQQQQHLVNQLLAQQHHQQRLLMVQQQHEAHLANGHSSLIHQYLQQPMDQRSPPRPAPPRPQPMPPGFNHLQSSYSNNAQPAAAGFASSAGSSKLLGLMQLSTATTANLPQQNGYGDVYSENGLQTKDHSQRETKDWQEGLRALLPNINISFGAQAHSAQQPPAPPHATAPPHGPFAPSSPVSAASIQHKLHAQSHNRLQNQIKTWPRSDQPHLDPTSQWESPEGRSASVPEVAAVGGGAPHWLASLHHLTEDSQNLSRSHNRLPFVQQFPSYTANQNWSSQQASPPPGFQSPLRSQASEHTLLAPADARQ